VAIEHPDSEAFLVQINPRVSTQFTGSSSRVLHALEADTGKSFLFEGSEGLALDHFAITFMGTREEVEERALPFRQGDEVLVEIVEPHMYDVDDAVAKIDGYIISIAGAAQNVGEKRMIRIDQVGRTAASALLLDEDGEVVIAAARPARPPRSRSGGASSSGDDGARAEGRRRRGRAQPDAGESEAREEAGLPATATALDDEPEQPPAEAQSEEVAPEGPQDGEDGLQSKPRRRGRRGGRRRSAAKAKAAE
jgi:ribonuclease G